MNLQENPAAKPPISGKSIAGILPNFYCNHRFRIVTDY